jgi:regulator of protease activity HflC (stomatin/prohibitin superfamily)
MSDARSRGDGPPPADAPGPILQSAVIGFRVVYIVTVLLGLLWLVSNCRIVSSDSQAVVSAFGRIVRTQRAGLLLAWPRPIEEVRELPGPDRQLSRPVAALPPVPGIAPPGQANGDTAPPGATPYLTGDGKVVLLDASLIYRIADPTAYVLAQDHVAPAVDRLFRAAAVEVAAGQSLNDFLVFQSTGDRTGEPSIEAVRGAVRDRLLKSLNSRLENLTVRGAGLGIEIDRIDMTAWLPPEAKQAFDAVLTASQKADQDIAAANTSAELRRQGARREADRLISAAEAAALERTVAASVDTASIGAIERTPGSHVGLAEQSYRNTIGGVLAKAGAVVAIDPKSGGRLLTNGAAQTMPLTSMPPSLK